MRMFSYPCTNEMTLGTMFTTSGREVSVTFTFGGWTNGRCFMLRYRQVRPSSVHFLSR
ncbi:hypothetical protein DPMN_147070 [Dreissena polymorpha]|uniref:Uncharacterized protein n=1 Tax=Dreissena polymorpha TaxID=45954 RepID=A0A9D4FBI8_DREPO|nr:hypothetical protein DPMN_147070 [Dreissena polymorpha]